MNYNRGCYNQPRGCGYNTIKPYMDSCRQTNPAPKTQNSCRNNTNNDYSDMNYKLAMVYPAYQEWQNIYCGEKALMVGTIFAELDKPFFGGKTNCKCNNGGLF